MNSIFKDTTVEETTRQLINNSTGGDEKSLSKLIRIHQQWIYNIVFKMTCNKNDAEDITQEVLIKIVKSLNSFKQNSSFRTWVYRIACNHIINAKQSKRESSPLSDFNQYGKCFDELSDYIISDTRFNGYDSNIIADEIRNECIAGMLICLERPYRMAFILGTLFGVNDITGAEIMSTSRENFRKLLSRSRQYLYNFMNSKCGLMNPENPCKCRNKIKSMIEKGYLDPEKLIFNSNFDLTFKNIIPEKTKIFTDHYYNTLDQFFLDQPFFHSQDFSEKISVIMKDIEL